MTMSKSLAALRRANPRAQLGFDEYLDAATDGVRRRFVSQAEVVRPTPARRPRLLRATLAAATLALAAAAALAGVTLRAGEPGVESAVAAVRKAATLSASSAERSGTAVVRITRGGEIWAASTIRWHDADLALSSEAPRRPGRTGSHLLLVDGMMYGLDPTDGGWVELGSPESIDPDSGTTPAEYLAAVREDVGGATLRRIVDGMKGLATSRLDDESVVYSGTVAAGLIARESGFKEGRPIRVFPFGYVAHGEAADPAAPLHVAVTVRSDVVRQISVTWGAGDARWTYTVTYTGLGTTAAPAAPADARPLGR
jgi:hypothetical protein